MATRLVQANALVQEARRRSAQLKVEYEKSLHEREVRVELQVAIKGVLDELRSALDYVAYELYEQLGNQSRKAKVYFPIAALDAKQDDFRSLVGRNIPGLPDNRPDAVTLLQSFQAFSSAENQWLPRLATLAIENKHANLTAQVRREDERIAVRSSGMAVSWNPNCVKFGRGVSVCGAPIDPSSQMPVPGPQHEVRREIWVNFRFATTGQSVLPFLDVCIKGTARIVNRLREYLHD